MSIAENIARVRERVHRACERAGRPPESVRLVAVTKTVPPEAIRLAYAAGVRDFGENRVQEAAAKRPQLHDLDAVWHLIGHLQSNKAKHACQLFSWVHSVDSVHIAQRMDHFAAALGKKMPVLIEVHLGGEASKFGVEEAGLMALAEQVGAMPSLELRGLMTVPPFFENAEDVRPFFRRLRELASRLESLKLPGVSMRELSMGMSHDFEIAIEEGATMVRIGTAIFGERPA
ncbi:MAG TPA: YggS family pyridoxal phosphate-dependent enzyme [Terriglobia bacterium]|nr:YggS family pyridoxal phosphate-dependent enzyme [Terriglobia bacterium]